MRNRALVVAAAEPDNTTHIAVATSIGLTTTFFISGKQAGAVANRVLNGENIDAVRYATSQFAETDTQPWNSSIDRVERSKRGCR